MSTTTYAVRMGMSAPDAEALSDILLRCPDDVAERVQDQLWLRSVLVEQRRRARIDERGRFDIRADRILALLDPPEVP